MQEHDIMRKRLLIAAGIDTPPMKHIDIDGLRKTEWSPEFEQFMRNRLVMGSFRYQKFEDKRKSFDYDTASEAIKRIGKYQSDGNTEHLVDAANMCLLEFEFGKHPLKHFASIDDGEHAEKKKPEVFEGN